MKNHAILFSSRAFLHERSSGAHRIATYLRANDWDVEVIDFAAHWPLESLQQLVRQRTSKHTVFFGFSTFFNFWNDNLSNLTEWMKQKYPSVKTVLGGQNVAHTKAKGIDYWVDSYGEIAMLELAKSLAGNTPQGLKFDFSSMGSKKLITALSAYPAYNLGSYQIIMEQRDFLKPFEWLTVEFSRGCKFSCDFCNFPILGVKEDTSRNAADFEYEMKYNYDNFGIKNYYVADETFNDRKEKIIKFADVVESLDFKPFFSGFIRADLMVAHPDTVEQLGRMNFGGQYYGIETFNHASGKIISKGMNPDKLKQGILDVKSRMSKYGFYRGTISLIVGLPYDTKEHWIATDKWLTNNWTDQGIVIFPLDVQDLKEGSADHYTNISAFSKNLEKYGLREMKVPPASWGDTGYYFNWKNGNWYKGDYMWEHDTMNILEARDIADQLQKEGMTKYKVDSWTLGIMEYNQQKSYENLKDMASITKNYGAPDWFVAQAFIKEYIESKLNI